MPQKIEWKSTYSVGHSLLDAQHKVLLNACNALIDLIRDDSKESDGNFHIALNDLAIYSRTHFEDEEKILIKFEYPEVGTQIEEHRKFESIITDFILSACQGFLQKKELTKFILEWWLNHVLSSDMQYKNFIKEK